MNTDRPPIWQLVKQAVQAIGGDASYSEIKQSVWSKFPEINASTLTATIICCSVNHPSRIHYPENKKPRVCAGQYDFLFNTGRGRATPYDVEKHGQWEIAEIDGSVRIRLLQEATVDSHVEVTEEQGSAFALESHLRDYLAKNLPNLDGVDGPLNLFVSEDGRDGVEFQTDVGPIDILACTSSGDLYVFELKLGRGPDSALGQILRYMGWVEKHLCKGKKVAGIIVAYEISTKLKYAASQVPHIRLMEYELKVSLRPAALPHVA